MVHNWPDDDLFNLSPHLISETNKNCCVLADVLLSIDAQHSRTPAICTGFHSPPLSPVYSAPSIAVHYTK